MECRSGLLKELKLILLQLVSGKFIISILQTLARPNLDVALRVFLRVIQIPQYCPSFLNKPHQFKPTHHSAHLRYRYSFNDLA